MNRDDVLKVDELKAELSDAFRTFERKLTTVIERYNDVDTRLDAVSRRLLDIEKRLGPAQ